MIAGEKVEGETDLAKNEFREGRCVSITSPSLNLPQAFFLSLRLYLLIPYYISKRGAPSPSEGYDGGEKR